MRDDSSPSTYRFGPLQRRGVIAGWRGGQIAVVAGGLLVAVGAIRMAPNASGAVTALVILGLAVLAATWPIAGRTGDEWAPDLARFAAAVAGGTTRWRLRPPPVGDAGLADGRGPFAGLRIVPVEQAVAAGGARRVGIVHDRRARTYTAVLPVHGQGFILLDGTGRDQRVASWASALAALAHEGSSVWRVQWLARAAPADPASARATFRPPVSDATPPAVRDSYEAFLLAAAPTLRRHHCFVAVSVHAGRSARLVRTHGGGDAGACRLLLTEAASLRRRLADADLHAGAALSPVELAGVVRGASSSATPVVAGARWPWPTSTDARWSALRCDAVWHATYWIAEWPRTEVHADFLAPLLLAPDVRQTVSVTMAPVAPLQAARQVEQARTVGIADDELRRRGGFLATARRRRQEETLAQREEEMADGHATFRFCGYVTVSTDDASGLDEACAHVEQAAGRAGIELRRCYGDQLQAFTATLPLGRGLR